MFLNSKTFLAALALAAGLSANAEVQKLTDFRQREAIEVRTPVINDSVTQDGSRYDVASLLQSSVVADFEYAAKAQADTAGVIALSRPERNASLHMLQTRIRAERFMKGSLKVTSTDRFEVLLDGKSIMSKTTVQDSINAESLSKAELRLEPEIDYTLVIKVLSNSSDKAQPTLSVEFEPGNDYQDIAFHSGADMLRRFAMCDVAFGEKGVNVSISPDGNYLLTLFRANYSVDRSRAYATLTDLRTGKVIDDNMTTDWSWMPRGSRLYKTVKAENGLDIIVKDIKTGAQSVIARNVPEIDFSFSPDEKALFYYHTEEGVAEQGPMRRYVNPDDRIPGNRTRNFIMRYDLATGLSERLTFGNRNTIISDIAPDSQRLVYLSYRDNPTKRPFTEISLYELDLNTLAVDTIVANTGFISEAFYSPDGKQLLIIGSAAAFDGLGKNCGEHPIPNDFDNQAYIMDIATREVKAISRDFNPNIDGMVSWNKADGKIYFRGEDGFYSRIFAYDPKTGNYDQLPIEVDNVNAFSIGQEKASQIAYIGQGYDHAGVVYLYDLKKRSNRLLADPFKKTLDQINLATDKVWQFTSSDGTLIDGVLCFPPDFDETKKYPLIVYYYGGTSPSDRSIHHPYTPQMFAARDYVVYVLNPSGTTGYGQEFSARHVNAWGKRTADEIIEGVKKLVAESPFIDAEKIGCIGASYGGFMTQYLQTKTDIFAAAVSHAGISNVTSYWGEGFWGYSYTSVAAADSYPWTDPQLFTEQGSLFNADKIDTPLLLLHGTHDTNVPVGESIQLFNALKILGKEVEFITVDGEDHVIVNYTKRLPWHNTIMAWFAKWLQDDSKWWDDLYPKRHM